MFGFDTLDTLFIVWAFFFQIVLIVHFAIRKRLFESYTMKYGWLVYALCFPAAALSVAMLVGGKTWSFWVAGFLFLLFAYYGYRVDYVKQINWRKPIRKDIMFPYVTLYLATIMFYWWPLGILSRPLWIAYAVLFLISTVLNVTSH